MSASRSLEINLRYNQNTLEQALLACIAWASLGVSLPIAQVVLMPVMATLFAIGRGAFWVGYLSTAWAAHSVWCPQCFLRSRHTRG
jgi:hypothetical protein